MHKLNRVHICKYQITKTSYFWIKLRTLYRIPRNKVQYFCKTIIYIPVCTWTCTSSVSPPTNPVVFSDLPCRVAWMLSSEFPPCLWGPGCWYSPTAWWGEEIKPAKKKPIVNQNRHVNQYMCSTYLWIQAYTSSMYLHACILLMIW